MIFIAPAGLIVAEKGKQATSLQLSSRSLYKKRAAPARADRVIDLRQQILRKYNMCPLCVHKMSH